MREAAEILVFDLCDTVVRTAGVEGLLGLPGLAGRGGEVEEWFGQAAVFFAYERGEVDTQAFLRGFGQDLGLAVELAVLEQVYEALVVEEIPGMGALLAQLKRRHRLCALSNNNPLLWRGIQKRSPAIALFDQVFLSQEIGALKPTSTAFAYVEDQLGCGADRLVLIDDNALCVAAARRLGWRAVHFSHPNQLGDQLRVLLLSEEK